MTPRERAEACLRFAGLSSTPCGTIPIVGLSPCDLPAGHRCAHYDTETWEKWSNAELAQDAPALARDLLAALDREAKGRKAMQRVSDAFDVDALSRLDGEQIRAITYLDRLLEPETT